MTGVAPGDETGHAPTSMPDGVSAFAAGPARGRADGTVSIAYMHSSRVSHSWHQSMMQMIGYDKTLGQNLIRAMPLAVSCSGPHGLVEGRNLAVKNFLEQRDEDWLFMVDTDMGFDPHALEQLWFASDPVDRPVVGGLCFAMKHVGADGKGGFNVRPIPTLFMWGETPEQGRGFVSRFRYPPDSMVQVAGTGAAFLLIHRSVLEKIDGGWFDLIQYRDGTHISEDLSFCYRVGQLDLPVYVHTGVRITHHKELWLSEDDYRMPNREPMARFHEAKQEAQIDESR